MGDLAGCDKSRRKNHSVPWLAPDGNPAQRSLGGLLVGSVGIVGIKGGCNKSGRVTGL